MGRAIEDGEFDREKRRIEKETTWSWQQSWAFSTSAEFCPGPLWGASTTSCSSFLTPILFHFPWEMMLLEFLPFSFHFVSYSEKLPELCIILHLPRPEPVLMYYRLLLQCTLARSWFSCGLQGCLVTHNSCSGSGERAWHSTRVLLCLILCECFHWFVLF